MPGSTERPVFFIIAGGNLASNLFLVAAFRRTVRAMQQAVVRG
jgi:hypothetical protein